jgi:DNA-directed RNA polymerase specialized sigma24 family protein
VAAARAAQPVCGRHAPRASIAACAEDGTGLAVSTASPHRTPEDSASDAQREEVLHRAWLALDSSHRALLALRAEGYTLAEIAEITGVAPDALNTRLYRARRSLARHLEQPALAHAVRMEIAK